MVALYARNNELTANLVRICTGKQPRVAFDNVAVAAAHILNDKPST